MKIVWPKIPEPPAAARRRAAGVPAGGFSPRMYAPLMSYHHSGAVRMYSCTSSLQSIHPAPHALLALSHDDLHTL